MQNGINQILEKYWGHKHFRPLQEEIINSIIAGNDTLALLPTGGGKSICFQVPAMAMDGICIVISPLIALMKDQVENLLKRGIKAVAITSAIPNKEIDITLDSCVKGEIKFLYLSPERLHNEMFQARLLQMKVSFIAVDEAHCISQWGYDFRPSYLEIASIREILKDKAIIALTATATAEVVIDIQEKLEFKKGAVFQKSFERTNLAYVVQKVEDKLKKLIKIANSIKGTGIVYVRNRKKTQETAEYLRLNQVFADFYHAGLDAASRNAKQENWIKNRTRIIVATNAFGMGIDKPDVRFVVHLGLPDCLEAYFQEAGRGGRDEKKAFAVVLYDQADIEDLKKNTENSFPAIDDIKVVYQALGNYLKVPIGGGNGQVFNFDISEFCNNYKMNAVTAYNSLKLLEKEGYINLSEAFYQPSRAYFCATKSEIYEFQIKHVIFDSFIKLLFRSYSGLFDGYVKISEYEMARRSNLPIEKVEEILKTLEKYGLMHYSPKSDLPLLMFNRERIDHKQLYFSKEKYFKRKKNAIEKMEAVINYITSSHKCRSKILLSYFGENNENNCGSCDVCLEEKKKSLTGADYDSISKHVKEMLTLKPLSISELVDGIKGPKEDLILQTVQWLIDNNQVLEKDQKLEWVLK
ncbi:MAG: RecQ family ATP-dependent DNA helicase [Bacteroidetes bacterium]|nr:RecQ family ATP-dependent DNA helicase [Bacteroidota bacterium]